MKNLTMPLIAAQILALAGCRNLYYKTMESFAYHKMDLPVSRVQDARDAQVVWLRVDPFFDQLRSDPRFETLLRRMNLLR